MPICVHTRLPNGLTCELDVELVLRLEDLDVERAVGGKVLHGPGAQDGLVVLGVGGVGGRGQWRGWAAGRALPGQGPAALTAAVRSTSLRLLRMKQASPLSILQSIGLSAARPVHTSGSAVGLGAEAGRAAVEPPPLCANNLTTVGTRPLCPLTSGGPGPRTKEHLLAETLDPTHQVWVQFGSPLTQIAPGCRRGSGETVPSCPSTGRMRLPPASTSL